MATIANDEFEAKLKKLRIKRKYLSNFKAQNNHTTANLICNNVRRSIEEGHEISDFYLFICAYFIWSETPEGYDFWRKIAESKINL